MATIELSTDDLRNLGRIVGSAHTAEITNGEEGDEPVQLTGYNAEGDQLFSGEVAKLGVGGS